MKITKRQLKRIIKEEKQKLIKENRSQEELADAVQEIIKWLPREIRYRGEKLFLDMDDPVVRSAIRDGLIDWAEGYK